MHKALFYGMSALVAILLAVKYDVGIWQERGVCGLNDILVMTTVALCIVALCAHELYKLYKNNDR